MNSKESISKKKIYLIGILTGVLLALSFPPIPLPLLSFVALVPLLYALDLKQYKKPFLLIYLTFFIYHGGANWWISSWRSETDPFLMISGFAVWLVHPFFFYIPFGFFLYFKRKFGLNTALWLLPFAWVGFEWFHSLGELAYPWLTVGYTQIYNRLWVQAADISGVWGLSFLIILINAILYKLILKFNSLQEEKNKFKIFISQKKTIGLSSALFLLIIVPMIYGGIRIPRFEHSKLLKENKTIRVGIIQPNIDPWKKWESNVIRQIRKHKLISDSLRHSVGKLDLVIWSETAIPFLNFEFNSDHKFSYIQDWIDSSDFSLLTGFADIYFYKDPKKASESAKPLLGDSSRIYDSYNSAIVINPTPYNTGTEIYRKMKLTPFGERVPYEELFQFAKKWVEWGVGISSWAFGQKQSVLQIKNDRADTKIGSIICIESIYPVFVRNFVSLDANILTVITNDGWYDFTVGPEQHYQIACMRAIETRRYIARCANTGVSGFITPTGNSLYKAPQYIPIGFTASVPLLNEKSFYVKYGDWLVYFCSGISVLFLFISFFRKSYN
ncbi:MAG: apolipoprotein N-acyltransferase [Bacteroidetes bacterium]|nr:MAG: apolipoprotein N-acyltransferase [Bacteroidota bacterium]